MRHVIGSKHFCWINPTDQEYGMALINQPTDHRIFTREIQGCKTDSQKRESNRIGFSMHRLVSWVDIESTEITDSQNHIAGSCGQILTQRKCIRSNRVRQDRSCKISWRQFSRPCLTLFRRTQSWSEFDQQIVSRLNLSNEPQEFAIDQNPTSGNDDADLIK
jgi:hypothetical protein